MVTDSVKDFLDYLDKVRARTKRLLLVVPPENLDWSYKPGKFTIGDQIRHIAAIERYLFAEIAVGRKNSYAGCGKSQADGFEQTFVYFEEMHQQSLEIFSSLCDEDLFKKCRTPTGGAITLNKWLRAMVEHEIHHRAQIYLYLNMLGVQTPPIFGLTAEDVEKISQREQ